MKDHTPTSRLRGWIRNEKARERRLAGLDEPGDELAAVLEDLGDAENYENWIVSLMEGALGSAVLEVGAGTGNLTRRLARSRSVSTVTAVEPHATLFATLSERLATTPEIRCFEGPLGDLDANGEYDSAIMVNVLEHIDDDVAVLRQMRDAVRPGGHVIVFSPAFEMLYSEFDGRVGHVRRYTRADLGRRFRESGLEVESSRYVNLPGFFGWLLIARLLKQNPTDPKRVETYDRRVVPWVEKLERSMRVPFGQSVLTVGRRAHEPAGTTPAEPSVGSANVPGHVSSRP